MRIDAQWHRIRECSVGGRFESGVKRGGGKRESFEKEERERKLHQQTGTQALAARTTHTRAAPILTMKSLRVGLPHVRSSYV